MRNFCRLFGIIATAALIGFSMSGCSMDDDSPARTPPPEVRTYRGSGDGMTFVLIITGGASFELRIVSDDPNVATIYISGAASLDNGNWVLAPAAVDGAPVTDEGEITVEVDASGGIGDIDSDVDIPGVDWPDTVTPLPNLSGTFEGMMWANRPNLTRLIFEVGTPPIGDAFTMQWQWGAGGAWSNIGRGTVEFGASGAVDLTITHWWEDGWDPVDPADPEYHMPGTFANGVLTLVSFGYAAEPFFRLGTAPAASPLRGTWQRQTEPGAFETLYFTDVNWARAEPPMFGGGFYEYNAFVSRGTFELGVGGTVTLTVTHTTPDNGDTWNAVTQATTVAGSFANNTLTLAFDSVDETFARPGAAAPPPPAGLVGTWEADVEIPDPARMRVTFANDWSWTAQARFGSGAFENFARGTFTLDGTILVLTRTHAWEYGAWLASPDMIPGTFDSGTLILNLADEYDPELVTFTRQ